MSEPILSDDGFWKFDEGEWIPTEKQLLSIENGAIPHDAVDRQNVLIDSSKTKRNPFSTFYSNMRPETRLYSFVGVCVSVTFLSLILVLASLPITSNPVLPVTDCSDSKPLQVIRAESVDSSPLMDEENCPHELKIASWNLENFGQSKANNPEELSEIAGKIRNYDIVAVQEIEDKNTGTAPYILQDEIDEISEYGMVLSNRTGAFCEEKSNSYISEQYAFYYNLESIQAIDSGEHYPNNDCDFAREPFAARFQSSEYDHSFVLITLHVKPDDAVNEISALSKVFEWARYQYPSEDDFIVLGDLNAGCDYASPSELDELDIRNSEYQWVISDDEKTNTAETSSCAYDRMIIGDGGIDEYLGSYSTDCEVENSDHCIISATFSAHES